MKIGLSFYIFCLTLVAGTAADCASLHIGGREVTLTSTQITSPALGIRIGGTNYFAAMDTCPASGDPMIRSGGVDYSIYTPDNYVLQTEISGINSCSTMILQPGRYKVQLRGGTGGAGGTGAVAGTAGVNANNVEYVFCLNTATTIYTFRGGNGNMGLPGKSSGSAAAPGGGGASGVPSMVIVGSNVYKSEGGDGGRGGGSKDYNGAFHDCGGGGGGGIGGTYAKGTDGRAKYSLSGATLHLCGGGGGGSPSGAGGAEASDSGYYGRAGGTASTAVGGKGGTASRLLSDYDGGFGGESVTWSCGGQTLYSYGGGGGGGMTVKATGGSHYTGVKGGTGSTGASSTSYVRIYKLQ